ncbi:MAG: ester cyclase [Nitrososphaerales archaeon]
MHRRIELMSVMEKQSKVEDNVKVVRQLQEAVFNQHNTARFGEFFEKNAKWHGGALGTVEGTENMVGLFGSVFSAIPDLHLSEQEIVAQGDNVVVRVVVEGTHKGNLLGIPATEKHLRWDGVDLYKLANGKVTDDWAGDDWLAIMIQTGAFKPPWMKGGT